MIGPGLEWSFDCKRFASATLADTRRSGTPAAQPPELASGSGHSAIRSNRWR
ncbi:hypothetical protein AIOL_003532 [Candidatus Rhodobacter oscarellae]|uniref:Uncharacterized protein n=1 Tax=Candidatus Rhodobacter oscarellae TaxID=1675527 RepID=A0A0J9E710_9RHOB|nr:hypothetical protein AIOL_003532 [Candidatus Rhodobacter lobularis]